MNTYTSEELLESQRQIDSIIHKLRETIKTFEQKQQPDRYKSQLTLANRRIRALEIALHLIQQELTTTS